MQLSNADDLTWSELPREELEGAWDQWSDLARWTNGADPPSTHGVFAGRTADDLTRVASRTGDEEP